MSAQLKSVPNTGGKSEAARSVESASLSVADIPMSQRAAGVIAVLGQAAAKPIVDKLDNTALSSVAEAIESVSVLSREQLVAIVVDFLNHLQGATGSFRGGKSKAREVVESVLEPQRLNLVFGEAPPPEVVETNVLPVGTVWARLQQQSPESVASYLNGLTPNLIALVIQKLNSELSSDVLCHLAEDKLLPTMGAMLNPPPSDPGIEAVLERMIDIEFLNAPTLEDEESSEHLEAISDILSLIPNDKRDKLVSFMREQHQDKLTSIENQMIIMDTLQDVLPLNAIPVVFREVDKTVLTQMLGVLQGTNPPIAEYLLENISSRMADQFRFDLEGFEAPSEDKASAIEREFLTGIMNLKREGKITLEKPQG